MVRLPGPAVLDPDEHAAAHYFSLLAGGHHLGEPLLSTPKPLLTGIHGLAWWATHDWRAGTALTVAAFALAVVALARAATRLAGAAAGLAVALALLGSGALVLQVARGNSLVWALAGWAVAVDALSSRPRRWGIAAAALLAAGLARSETWLLLVLAAAWGVVAWRRGERRAALLLVPLAAPLLWLGHDWLLTGDPLWSAKVPERYTDLVAGRDPVPPAEWLATLWGRYAPAPLLLVLAGAGAVWLARRRSWLWLGGLAVTVAGILALLGAYAWRGTYISWRYFDPADTGLRVAAALGAAWLAGAVAARWTRPPLSRALASALAVALVAAASWPLAPLDPLVDSTLDRDTRLSANAAAAADALRPLAREPATVIAVSGPQRVRLARELALPLARVRDLFLATRTAPLEQALDGVDAVFHDADGDRPLDRFAPLSVTAPTRIGDLTVTPMSVDPSTGLYVLRVQPTRYPD